MLYYSHSKEQNKKSRSESLENNPIGTNQKKGSSIITGAKEKDNEEN